MILVSLVLVIGDTVHIFLTDHVEFLCLAHILILCILIMVFLRARLLGHYVLCTILMLLVESYVIKYHIYADDMGNSWEFLGMYNVHFLSSLGVWQTYNIGWLKTNLN